MSLRSGKLPFLGSDDEFFDHRGISSITGGGDVHTTRFEFADALLDTIVCRKLWRIPSDANLHTEANRISSWCFDKTFRYLQFGEDFVLRFLGRNGVFV
jgi:hypothetical protein